MANAEVVFRVVHMLKIHASEGGYLISKVSPDFIQELRWKLGLEATASEADILAAVEQILERMDSSDRIKRPKSEDAALHSEQSTGSDQENQSRVEKIRDRVRELNDHYGNEITPMAMFERILAEFTDTKKRKD